MKKRKVIALLLALAMMLSLCACGGTSSGSTSSGSTSSGSTPGSSQDQNIPDDKKDNEPSAEPTELIVFAAASMTETLTELGNAYMAEHENINIVFNFDSSGTLKTQIQEGADVDIFISAGQKQMNQLDINADPSVNTEGLDFVLEGTRFNILENKVALVVPEDNPANINSYDDLIAGLTSGTVMLAMGNSDVPVGQYTQKILAYYQLNEEELASGGCITYGSNVKEVTTQVSETTVDCGIIYQTDAFSAGLTVVDTATAEMCGQVIYPAAVMSVSKNADAAKEFLEYLTSDKANEVFENVGFTPIKPAVEITVTDQAGREVTVGDVNSIVLCWYMSNDFVLSLGRGDDIVAIGPYDDFQALVCPKLNDLDTAGRGKPDLEKLASINPDLFIHRVSDPDNLAACDELGIPAIAIAPETAEETMDALRIIGKALGESERAEMLIEYYNSIIAIAEQGVKENAGEDKHSFLILGSDMGNVASNAMMQAQMICIGGGVNLAADVTDSNSWTNIGTEQIFAYDPEFLFVSSSANFTVEDIMNDPAWADLTAVKNGNVYAIPSSLHSWENLGLAPCIGSVWVMSVMYPGSISEQDFDDMVIDFYKTVYDLDVTRDMLGY